MEILLGFYSRILYNIETRYLAYNRELLAIHEALEILSAIKSPNNTVYSPLLAPIYIKLATANEPVLAGFRSLAIA
jgi:hypothetical protein